MLWMLICASIVSIFHVEFIPFYLIKYTKSGLMHHNWFVKFEIGAIICFQSFIADCRLAQVADYLH
ncbi:MAG TPA: hypothetical protein DCQ58_11670 [Saprospirales bacterium]|nr:hypothetical protein [Saprospirales bacterium]